MTDSPLRLVTAADKPEPKKKPDTLSEAAEQGERDLLVMMRDTIANRIDAGPPPHTLAPLMRQLREIDKEIRSLDARAEHEAKSSGANEPVSDKFDASAI
ncbi:flagellar protein FliT [Mycolicibacterium brisbanense]|uniref:Terminase small subunit n=1 Tax=Mycolicibacterium brisbanense TaxID=146020 RepID=A0A100W6T0_9MYCO|nr:flagellar protein FliT [Mycolicibacterium brisbanense]MCV7158028.1 flagellar protein FliT [Mycolicibacterium brisbanense]GAS92678.1 uncharacterized protein RMCB_6774 [Mycolicibacterium brisbanense]